LHPVTRSWVRKDNRVEQYTVEELVTYDIQLQASGFEPLMIYNNGADVKVGYNRGGPWFDIPDGYQYTWELQHPFGTEFYLYNTGAITSTVTFFIGGQTNVNR